jgi:broad specificity phosphatase PhoE
VRLILVRHGQSEGNASGILQGRLDFGLTALGRVQAEATARHLAGLSVDRLLSSPLGRATQTAEPIAAALRLPIEPEPGLMEYDVGEVSGLSPAEIRERYPDVIAAYRKGLRPAFPGEEGRDAFHARVRHVVESLQGTKQTVVAVAHGGVISAVCYQVLGMAPSRRGAFETANGSITEVVLDRQGRLVLTRQNDVCHLAGVVTTLDMG